jgi:hypothetical protein
MVFAVKDGVRGEGIRAKPPGNDLYEIRHTPWRTCEIHWGGAGLMNTVALRLASQP